MLFCLVRGRWGCRNPREEGQVGDFVGNVKGAAVDEALAGKGFWVWLLLAFALVEGTEVLTFRVILKHMDVALSIRNGEVQLPSVR
jgi:hypothetical protein